jgi:hypothetical protein
MTLMRRLANHLREQGWVLRSGGAEGADEAFEQGVMDDPEYTENDLEIYLPWPGFCGHQPSVCNIVAPRLQNWSQAVARASLIHPIWNELKRSHQLLHGRNIYQVYGLDLESPAAYIVYYARERADGEVDGGTRTAVMAARQAGVRELNLYRPAVLTKLTELLDAEEPEVLAMCYEALLD